MGDVDNIRGRADPTTFLIGRRAGVETCESLISASGPDAGARRLEMVLDWKLDRWPGGSSFGAQSVVTWARSQEAPEFRTSRRQAGEDDFFFDLTRRLHGITACLMAKRVIDGRTGMDVTRRLHEFARGRIKAMDALDVETMRRGQSISLVCVDHSSMAYLKPLYHASLDEPEVRGVPDFQDLMERLIPEVAPSYGQDLRPLAADLATVVYELFLNSHIHGRRDASGSRLKRSVRSVTLSQRTLWRTERERARAGDAGLDEYFRLIEQHSASDDTVKLFEVSVMDSGPGLAARMMKAELDADVTIGREYDIVRSCFLKNVSSRAKAGYGMGLWRVLNVLRERGGLVRLRTGRLSLTRFFDPVAPDRRLPLAPGDVWLRDSRNREGGIDTLGRAAGTVVTILVPLGLRKG